MHADIQKLIDIAKQSGELNDNQKAIILRKAEKLGEDIDEVEMILESLKLQTPQKNEPPIRIKIRKCPNCGATVPASEVKCPDCGMIMEQEAESSARNRDYIADLQNQLKGIQQQKGKRAEKKHEEKMLIIHSFSVPMTKEAQIIAFNFAKARYEALSSNVTIDTSKEEDDERAAWLAKAKEFYGNIEAMHITDAETKSWLDSNRWIIQKQGKRVLTTGGMIGTILIVIGVIALIYIEWAFLPWKGIWKFVLSYFSASLLFLIIAMPRTTK